VLSLGVCWTECIEAHVNPPIQSHQQIAKDPTPINLINPEGTNNYSFRLTQVSKDANYWFEILTPLGVYFNCIYIIVKVL
jgi:hypothetical protein